MSRREESVPSGLDVDVSRRGALKAIAGGGALLGVGKSVDNVLIGYGTLLGTDLVSQASSGDLASIVDEGLGPHPHALQVGDHRIEVRPRPGHVVVKGTEGAETFAFTEAGEEEAAAADAEIGLGGVLDGLVTDLAAVEAGEHAFEFHRFDAFFDRLDAAEPRPFAVGALRGWPPADSELVARFTGADPADPSAVLRGLVGGFREHAYYDAPRYVAGAIQDNVIFGALDLRASFRDPVGFESLLADGGPGLFCYEFTHRSIEAIHAVPAHEQAVPVVGARVWDKRHKHVYTAVASAIRDDGELRVPMTFVDYTHTTLYDDLNLRGALGEGFEAYNGRHRATVTHWRP